MEKRPNSLEERIRRRRAGEQPAVARPKTPATVADDTAHPADLRDLKARVEQAGNPMAIARLLGSARDHGHRIPEIAIALDCSRGWVHDRLNLLACNPIDQRDLEFGKKTIWAVKQERKEKLADLARSQRIGHAKRRRRKDVPYLRKEKYTLDRDTIEKIAHLIDVHARSLGLAPITVAGQTHKQLTDTIYLRTQEVWDVLKPK